MKEHLISAIIPCFNAEPFLRDLIESIVNQSYQNWEAIFVDDGSTDNSISIIKEYQDKEPRIRLVLRNEMPKGAPTCRNIGMNSSKGDFLIFLDADDVIAEKCFENRLTEILNSNVDFCVFPLISFRDKPFDIKCPLVLGFPTKTAPIHYLIQKRLPFSVVTNIYNRKSLCDNSISWDVKVRSLQDSDFNISCIVSGLSYKISKTAPDYYWRVSGNEKSISKQIQSNLHFDSHIYVFNKQYELFKDRRYVTDFMSFAIFLVEKMLAKKSYDAICKFTECDFFAIHSLFRFKVQLVCGIMRRANLNKISVFRVMIGAICPIWCVYDKLSAYAFGLDAKNAVKELACL